MKVDVSVDLPSGSQRSISSDPAVAQVTVNVTDSDSLAVGTGNLVKTGTKYRGQITITSLGLLTFVIQATDSLGTVIYQGTTTTSVSGPGEAIQVGVTLVKQAWSSNLTADSYYDKAYDVVKAGDGFLVSAGTGVYGAGGTDGLIVEMTANGTIVRSRTFGGANYDQITKILPLSTGGWILVGYTYSYGTDSNSSNFDAWVLSLDSSLNILWSKTLGVSGQDEAFNTASELSDGSILLGGTKENGTTGSQNHLWLVKINLEGTVQWQKSHGTSSVFDQFEAYSFLELSDGIVVGSAWRNSGGLEQTYMLKVDKSNGNRLAHSVKDSYGSDLPAIKDLFILPSGKILASGRDGFSQAFLIVDPSTLAVESGRYLSLGSSGSRNTSRMVPSILADEYDFVTGKSGNDIYLGRLKVSATNVLSIVSQKLYGTAGESELPSSLCLSTDGHLVIVGHSGSFSKSLLLSPAPDGSLSGWTLSPPSVTLQTYSLTESAYSLSSMTVSDTQAVVTVSDCSPAVGTEDITQLP